MGGSEESDPEARIWDSKVNMDVASDTDEEEGSLEGDVEILDEGLDNLESIHQQVDKSAGCIGGSKWCLEEDCSEEEALSGTTDSLPVLCVCPRDQTGTHTTIRVAPRKHAVTRVKEKNTSCFHYVNLV